MYLETTKPIWLVDSRWGGAGEEEQEYIQEACMDVGRKGFQRISYYRVQVKTLQPTGQIQPTTCCYKESCIGIQPHHLFSYCYVCRVSHHNRKTLQKKFSDSLSRALQTLILQAFTFHTYSETANYKMALMKQSSDKICFFFFLTCLKALDWLCRQM